MDPLISVLLPVFNAERYVEGAVQSVLSQTYTNFELLIVDDGSTDRSARILNRLAEQDPRIHVRSRPNTGLVGALNEMLDAARGEFVARMDSDDVALPTRFEKQVGYLRSQPDCVLVGSQVLTIDEDSLPIGTMPEICFGHDAIDQALLRRGWPIVHPAVMMRTAAVRRVGRYVTQFFPSEDHDLFLRLAEAGKLENLPDVLLHYRKHAASASAVKDDHITEAIVEACARRSIPVLPEYTAATARHTMTGILVQRGWAWRALKNGNVQTARKYAGRVLRKQPLSIDHWKLMYCAVRGH